MLKDTKDLSLIAAISFLALVVVGGGYFALSGNAPHPHQDAEKLCEGAYFTIEGPRMLYRFQPGDTVLVAVDDDLRSAVSFGVTLGVVQANTDSTVTINPISRDVSYLLKKQSGSSTMTVQKGGRRIIYVSCT